MRKILIFADTEIVHARISGSVRLEPFRPDQLNPASYDLRLSRDLRVRPDYGTAGSSQPLDLQGINGDEYLEPLRISDGYVMEPGEFLLAATQEVVALDRWTVGRVEGKSSLARVGLAVHVTGGFIDPGFHGQITLEMANLFHRPLVLRRGMRIAQIAFSPVQGEVAHPYADNGHYQYQTGPTLSRYQFDR